MPYGAPVGSIAKPSRPAVMTSIGSIMKVLPAALALAAVASRSSEARYVDHTLGKGFSCGLGLIAVTARPLIMHMRSHRPRADRPGCPSRTDSSRTAWLLRHP